MKGEVREGERETKTKRDAGGRQWDGEAGGGPAARVRRQTFGGGGQQSCLHNPELQNLLKPWENLIKTMLKSHQTDSNLKPY